MQEVFNKIIEKVKENAYMVAQKNNSKELGMTLCGFEQVINEVSAEYNNGWIPCSERLPEAGKRYLVSAIWKDKDFEKSAVYDAVYGSDALWHSYNYEPVSYKVTAWKPLPEPYLPKGE